MNAWDTLALLFSSPWALLLLAVFGVTLVILIVTGYGKVNIKGVELTKRDKALLYKEHVIIRNQTIWLEQFITGQASRIHAILQEHPEGQIDAYKEHPEFYVKWALEAITNYIIVNWIALNHLKKSDAKARASDLTHYLGSLTHNYAIDKVLFGPLIDECTEIIIENLLSIRARK